MTRLILIRHGQSEANLLRVFAGNYDVELTELGCQQAQCTAEYIAKNYKIDKDYASDLKRAFKTAEYVAEKFGLEVIPEKGFREIYAGEWEAVKFDDLAEKFPEDWDKWRIDIGNSRCTGGESVRELGERVIKTLEKVAEDNDGKTIAIGTHATPVRSVQCVYGEYGYDHMMDFPWVSNASVTELVYEDGKFTLVKIGEDRHLEGLISNLPANV